MGTLHRPVLLDEVVAYLEPAEGKTLLDMTVGMAGHARALIQRGAFVIGLDRDRDSLSSAERNLEGLQGHYLLLHGRMSQAPEILAAEGIEQVDGALIDAGVSMDQLMDPHRGFSAHSEESLDMRMDRSEPGSLTGFDVVSKHLEKDLHRVFSVVGNRREAGRVVKRIVNARKREAIRTAAQLAELIAATMARGRRARKIDAAVYLMAIRAEVNEELTELRAGIEQASSLLSRTGNARLVVLTWNSSEHRISRQTCRRLANPCTCPPALPCTCGKKPVIRILTPKLSYPREEEVAQNPAARSVRLNVVEKI